MICRSWPVRGLPEQPVGSDCMETHLRRPLQLLNTEPLSIQGFREHYSLPPSRLSDLSICIWMISRTWPVRGLPEQPEGSDCMETRFRCHMREWERKSYLITGVKTRPFWRAGVLRCCLCFWVCMNECWGDEGLSEVLIFPSCSVQGASAVLREVKNYHLRLIRATAQGILSVSRSASPGCVRKSATGESPYLHQYV